MQSPPHTYTFTMRICTHVCTRTWPPQATTTPASPRCWLMQEPLWRRATAWATRRCCMLQVRSPAPCRRGPGACAAAGGGAAGSAAVESNQARHQPCRPPVPCSCPHTGYGRAQLCDLLLSVGADKAAKNNNGKTAFDLAVADERNPVFKDEATLAKLRL